MKNLRWAIPMFYVLTFVFTIILAVSQEQLKISYDKIILPQIGPFLAVLLTVLFFSAFRKSLNFKFDFGVFQKIIIALFLPIFVFGAGFFICKLFIVNTTVTQNLMHNLFLTVPGMIIGAIGEEIGWRGFLQTNLEKKYSVLLSSIITGLMWGLWHVGNYKNGPLFLFGFLLFTISASIILRRLLENSNNNILVSVIFHLAINIAFFTFFKESLTNATMIICNGILWTILAFLVSFFNPINILEKIKK